MSDSSPSFLWDVQLQRCSVIGGFGLLVYDYLLTFDDEIQYIWNSPWTPVKIVYLLNRYGVLLGQTIVCAQEVGAFEVSQRACEIYAIFLGVHIVLSLETGHILVILRAWVIWGACPFLLLAIALLYVATLASIVPSVVQGNAFTNLGPIAAICYRSIPVRAWLLFVASLALDTFVYSFTSYALWRYRRTFGRSCPPLVRMLMLNVTTFYLVNVVHHIAGLVCWTVLANTPKAFISIGIASPILAISGQRVVHNLRRIRVTSFSTQDLSQVIDQQMKGFASTSHLPREADNQTLPVIIEEEEEDTHKGVEMVDMSGHNASSFDVEVDSWLPGESSLCMSEDCKHGERFDGSPV